MKELILSGGGVRALCMIGYLKKQSMDDLESVAGTSMGALLGCLFACGYNARELEDIFMEIDWSKLFAHNIMECLTTLTSQYAVNDGNTVKDLLHSLVYNKLGISEPTFDQLPRHFACCATDLVSNKMVVFSDSTTPNASVVQAVFCSMCLPLLFAPVVWDDMVLVDGSLKNNFPLSLRRCDPKEGLYVRVSNTFHQPNPLKSLDTYLGRIVSCTLSKQEKQSHSPEVTSRIVVLRCPFSTMHFKLSTTQKQRIIEAGDSKAK